MKIQLLAVTTALALSISAFAQTKAVTGTIYSGGGKSDYYLTIIKDGIKQDLKLDWMPSTATVNINPEFKDIIIQIFPKDMPEVTNLNPKYEYKKVIVMCSEKDGQLWVTKIENDTKAEALIEESLKSASCKVYSLNRCQALTEGEKMFKINIEGKKEKEKTIQNKNEYCKGKSCIKISVDKDGFIYGYELPNITDKIIYGKFIDDKYYECKTKDCSKIVESRHHLMFKGDKQKAAILIIAYEMFR